MTFDNFDDDRDEFEDDFGNGSDDYLQDDETSGGPGDPYLNQPFRKESSGMSTGMKILLAILGLGFLCVCVCCGGVLYFAWEIQRNTKMTTNAAEIETIRKEFIEIDIPADFTAKNGMTGAMLGMSGRMVVYQGKVGGDTLILMHGEGGPMNQQDFKFNMNNAQNNNQNAAMEEQNLEILETENREFTIAGKEVMFQFRKMKSKESDEVFHQVTGALPLSSGFYTIIFTMTEENWDEDQAVKMIESIKPVTK